MTTLCCYYVPPDQPVSEYGFIPSIVFAGKAGHAPMIGSGRLSVPWYWGKTLEVAEATCEQVNRQKFRVSPELADRIVASSMFLNPTTLKRAYELAREEGALD